MMVASSALAGLALSLAACGSEGDRDEPRQEARGSGGDAATAASAPAPTPALSGKAFAQKVTLGDNGRFQFEYTWPAAADAISVLRQRLDAERQAAFDENKGEWQKAEADSPPDCVPCRSRAYHKEWQIVTDLPRYLSLSASIYTYTGGAHGGTVFDALVWDRAAGKAIEPIDMFRSAASLDTATQGPFCAALDKERARRRGSLPKEARPSDPFYACIEPVANSTVILGSAKGRAFDRIGFLIPAYNAGPYAEGIYEITLPVTPAILDAIRPEYRAAFELR
ncbi:PdaC/SigV domain-containing protein [Croceicoccus sp. BE223]|uniref:PdaC/SigV domain-containing protein n=1 Tax=Croceicoccus sp. BE223 TaxID=2817716 RepID=UPI00286277D6|nr:DUF4163 domain-containing protein [Croceicoccus sp. BE223]MDR7101767.1 hypothetical protein [Croceicoccus sp. BE223]